METWAILVLVIGLNIITVLSSYFLTKMQVRHSDKRVEKQLESAREEDYRQRRREVRGESLLKLRKELTHMAVKRTNLVAAAHGQHPRTDATEEDTKRELQEAADDWNTYVASGDLLQTIFLQYDMELVNKVKGILKDYEKSYISAIYYNQASEKALIESLEVFERNRTKIIEVQELINKRLEEFRRLDENPPDIVISLDRRSKGWRLFRYDGTPVDFSLISDRPEVAFAHKSGFLAKTKERLSIDDLIALVSKAVTGF